MTAIDGYKCDGPGCDKVVNSWWRGYGATLAERREYKRWWHVERLDESDDPHFCGIDCLIAWATKQGPLEKKRETEQKKKDADAAAKRAEAAKKRKTAPKRKPTRKATSRKKKPARRRPARRPYLY